MSLGCLLGPFRYVLARWRVRRKMREIERGIDRVRERVEALKERAGEP